MSDGEPLDLTADERKALVALLRQTLEYARFPLAPRLDPAEGDLGEIGTAKASISTAAGGCWADPRQQAPAVTDEYRRRHSCAATSRCRRRGGPTRPVPCTCTPKRSCLTDRSNRPGSRSCRCENEIPHGWKPRDRSYKLRALPPLGWVALVSVAFTLCIAAGAHAGDVLGREGENAFDMYRYCSFVETADPSPVLTTASQGYCWGVFSTLQTAFGIVDSKLHPLLQICAPRATQRQLITVFLQYVETHPASASQDWGIVAFNAIRQAFPCPGH